MLHGAVLAFLKYLLAPSSAILLLLGFVFWLDSWELLVPAEGEPIRHMIPTAVWAGLAALPGYLRACWVVVQRVRVGPLQGCWLVISIVTGVLLSLVGGVMSLFTIVLGIAGLAAAGSAMWLLKDFVALMAGR